VRWSGHEGNIFSLVFSPDGSLLASASDDGSIRLWRVAGPGAAAMVLRGLQGIIYTLAFSPDGRLLASVSEDGTAWLWRLRDPRDPTSAEAVNQTTMADLVFEPTRGWRSRSEAEGTRQTPAQVAELIELACRRVGRNFTLEEWRQYIGASAPYRKLCPGL
jgi:hypothetical protein